MASQQIKIEPKGEALTILTGEAPKNIEPTRFCYKGQIGNPAEWLLSKKDDIDHIKAVAVFDYKSGTIQLDLNVGQENSRTECQVIGQLKIHDDLAAFRINANYSWELGNLANFLKFNRRYFIDKSANMDIVSGLKSFKGSVQRELEKTQDDRGNHRRLDDKRVHTSLPEVFTLSIPLFQGTPPTDIDVEILIEEKEGVVRVLLQSVSLLEKTQDYINDALNREWEVIKGTGITVLQV